VFTGSCGENSFKVKLVDIKDICAAILCVSVCVCVHMLSTITEHQRRLTSLLFDSLSSESPCRVKKKTEIWQHGISPRRDEEGNEDELRGPVCGGQVI